MDASEISQPKSAEYRHPKPPTRLSNTTSTAATAKQDISHGRMPCVSNLRSRGSAKAIKVSGVAVKIAPTITSYNPIAASGRESPPATGNDP